jgi:hypothetical protein
MPRMLGRYCAGGCACRDCGDGQPDTRWRKRVEARDLAHEFAEFADEAAEWAELTMGAAMETWPEL